MSADAVAALENQLVESVQLAKDDVEREKRALAQKEATLAREKQNIQMEMSRMGDLHKINSNIVELNVGGTHFSTALATLCCFPGSFIEAMFSGRHPRDKDHSGRFFIDRSPVTFEYVLNFLRTGVLVEPATLDVRRRFRLDLDYFGLTEFAFGRHYPGFQGGTVLDPLEKRLLSGWTDTAGDSGSRVWKLAYKGSRDGFEAARFHENCDNVGETLTLILDEADCLFGGYASVSWTSGGGPRSDPSSWLFTLRATPSEGSSVVPPPEKLEQTGSGARRAVVHNPGVGACFGGQTDFCVSAHPHANAVSSSSVGECYRIPSTGVSHLSSRKKFTVKEIEVYKRC